MPTKPHKTSHLKPLTVAQESAIDLLILGKSDREVAERIGVHRETVWHWRTHQAVFVAELNKRRQDMFGAAQQRLRALVGKALNNLETAVDAGSLKASLEVLKAAALYGTASPAGPTDPEAILDTWVAEAIAKEGIPEEEPDAFLHSILHKPNARYAARVLELRRQFTANGNGEEDLAAGTGGDPGGADPVAEGPWLRAHGNTESPGELV
jgi:hypothetical protein